MKHYCTNLTRRTFISGIAGFATLGAVSLAIPSWSFADTAAEKQAEADSVYQSLVDMQQQLDIASNNYTEALFALEDAQKRMSECQTEIDRKTAEIEELQDQLGTRARAMYRSGGNQFLEVVVESTTFEEFATNMDLLDAMNESNAILIANAVQAREDLEAAQTEYAEQERAAREQAEEAARIEAEAKETVAQMQATYDSLSAEAAELLEQERKAAEEEAARQAAAVVAASAAGGGEYQRSAENQAYGQAVESDSQDAEEGGGGTPDGGAEDAFGDASQEPADDGANAGEEIEGENVGDSSATGEDDESSPEESVAVEEVTDGEVEAPAENADDATWEEGAEAEGAAEDSEPVEETSWDDGSDDSVDSAGCSYEGGTDTVSRAYACLGAPYSWGAVGPDAYDCSGLVSYCLTGSHTRLGTTGTFMGWSQVSDPQPGDICTSSYHCGVYIGDGQMIHAADYGIGVIIGPVQSDMIIVRW